MDTFFIDRMATPQGELVLIADKEHRLRAIDWSDHYERLIKLLRHHYRADTLPRGYLYTGGETQSRRAE